MPEVLGCCTEPSISGSSLLHMYSGAIPTQHCHCSSLLRQGGACLSPVHGLQCRPSRAKHRHAPACQAGFNILADVCAATSGPPLQEYIVGGAVIGVLTGALYNGLKKDPQMCDLCQGVGGAQCFGCDGTGRMEGLEADKRRSKRNFAGVTKDAQQCRVCRGSGRVMCSKCKGSGYLSSL